MKTNIILTSILCLGLTFSSCSSDDDSGSNNPKLEGEYVGTYSSFSTGKARVTVTKKGGDEYLFVFTPIDNIKTAPEFTTIIKNSGISGIWQSSTSPYVQFLTESNSIRITSNTGSLYTYEGKK